MCVGESAKKGICSAKKLGCQEGRRVVQSSQGRSVCKMDDLRLPISRGSATCGQHSVPTDSQYRAAKEIRPKCRLERHRDGSEHTGKTHTIQIITLRVVAPSMLTKRSPCSCCASPQHTRMRPSPAPATRKSCRNVTSSSMSRASTMERSTLTITNVDSITSSPTSSPQN